IWAPGSSRRASGGPAQAMLIWRVIVEVRVEGSPPVATGFAFEPVCLSSESRIRFDDEPGEEKAMVLSSASLRLRTLLSALTYQNSSWAPVICAEMTRIGAPLEKAPMVARKPFDIATSTLPELRTCRVCPPPSV